jgi:serine/threonine protein kinase
MEYINFKLYDSNDFTNFHVIHEKPEYSQINYVIEKKTNEKKILKIYKTLNNNILNDYVSKELLINKYLSENTNITAKLNGLCIDNSMNNISLVLECGCMSLYDYYMKVHYNVSDIKVIFYEGIKLLHTLHSNGIVHNDIKLENFIFHNKELKLIDFGLSEFLLYSPPHDFVNNYLCTEYTKAPDIRKGFETDIFSFALTIVHLIINNYCKCEVQYTYYKCSYCNNNNICDYCDYYDLKIIVKNGNYKNYTYDQNYFLDMIGIAGYKLLKNMLNPEICKRINTNDILLDPYFSNFKNDIKNIININFNIFPNIKDNIFAETYKIKYDNKILPNDIFAYNINYLEYEYYNNLYETKYKYVLMDNLKKIIIDTDYNIGNINIFDKFISAEYFNYDAIINTLIIFKNEIYINKFNKFNNFKNDYVLYIFMMGIIFNSLFMYEYGTINIEEFIEEVKKYNENDYNENDNNENDNNENDNNDIDSDNNTKMDNLYLKIMTIYTNCLLVILSSNHIYFTYSILSYYIDKIYLETNLIEKNYIEPFKLKCGEEIYNIIKNNIINNIPLDTVIIYAININIAKLLNITIDEYNNLDLIPEMKLDLDKLNIILITEI